MEYARVIGFGYEETSCDDVGRENDRPCVAMGNGRYWLDMLDYSSVVLGQSAHVDDHLATDFWYVSLPENIN